MVVILDPQIAGISGDMLLSSLVNLGADKSKIIDGIYISENFQNGSKIKKIDFDKVKKHGIEATYLTLDMDESFHERRGIEIKKCISNTVRKIGLSEKATSFANSSIETLIGAESKIHGEPLESVHFHEASSLDTVIDIVGVAIALDNLNFFDHQITSTPVAVGSGLINFSHGTTSNPANAILEIFKNSNMTILSGPINEELTTPTGASMLVNLATSCSPFYPSLKIENIGYGAGTKNFDGFSNILKVVKGESTTTYLHDSVKILETNVDDVSGELLGHVIEQIMNNGAKDVTVTSAIGKKGRPTHLVSIICDSTKVDNILDVLISETGTLGIRIRDSERVIIPRVIKTISISIDNQQLTIHYKMIENSSNFKIEADDIKRTSIILKKSFKDTEELIRTKIKKTL